jgi:DHA2 family multidrug resistance protein
MSGEQAGGGQAGGGQAGTNPWLIAVVVTLGAFMEVLDTTIVNVSLPHIAGSLSVSNDEATWTLSTYLVANGIVLTISGALSRRIGRKKYFLICIAGFTAASLACGICTSFGELLLFRAAQGFFGGGLQPTQQAIILQTFPPEKRQQAFSLTAVATIIAPVLGPVLGGYLTDEVSWHWVFLVNIPIGIGTFFGVMHLVPQAAHEQEERRSAPPFDYWGTFFIALALGCMEIGIDRGEDYDWLSSPFIDVMAVLSLAGFMFGIVYLLRVRHPVVNLRVFKDRNFALSWLAIGMMGFVLYSSAVVIPQFAQTQLGYTATKAGLVLAPGAVGLIILIPVVGRLLKVAPVKYVIAFGGLALAGALLFSTNLIPNIDYDDLVIFRAAQSGALAFLFVPISSIAYTTVPEELESDATALFSMSRNVIGGVGISIATALVTDHLQTRQNRLVEHLTPVDQPYNVLLQRIQQAFLDAGHSMQQAVQSAPGEAFQMLKRQAAVLGYNDVFLITAGMALLLIPIALMMQNAKPKSGAAAG